MIGTAKETTVKGFLIFSGALAMLVGVVAMLMGNLHFLGFLRRKKAVHERGAMPRTTSEP
jgi:hypothetical protein